MSPVPVHGPWRSHDVPVDFDVPKVLSFHPPPRRAAEKRGRAARGP
jgi:hypothetical protein